MYFSGSATNKDAEEGSDMQKSLDGVTGELFQPQITRYLRRHSILLQVSKVASWAWA